MAEFQSETVNLNAADGHQIPVQVWEPSGNSVGSIQILHGMGEHILRYRRFAEAAVSRGYSVFGHDHRGHGDCDGQRNYFADENGWEKVIDDVRLVSDHIRSMHSPNPLFLVAHSMGSFVGQGYSMRFGERLNGMLLSGSSWPQRAQVRAGQLLARFESVRLGRRASSSMLDALGFGVFNRQFKPVRTDMDWLSRDSAEVDKYVEDPLCGGPFACGMWQDLLGGLLELGSEKRLAEIPAELPILITGGAADPVGGETGMTKLARRYSRTAHSQVALKLYPAGRHEMLNEVNREEVTADWLDWIAAQT